MNGIRRRNELHLHRVHINFFSRRHAIHILIGFFVFVLLLSISLSDVIHEESIQQARFLELNNGHERNNRFGDVINFANGKLEMDKNGLYQLVEMNDNCIKYCLEESIDGHNITAFWSVNKIRHRDEHRGYRFEWKISVRKIRNSRFDGKRNIEQSPSVRSFLIRDQDYPKYFETAVKKNDIKMEKRVFNTVYDKSEQPFQLDYRGQQALPSNQYDRGVEHLNTGEYYVKGSPPAIRYHGNGQPEIGAPAAAENLNHLHHHFFLNKNEVPIFQTSHFEKVSAFPAPGYNSLFPNSLPSVSRVHNQIDSYGDFLPTTSQAPFHFPNEVNDQEPIKPTTYRGHYDDNRQSILEGEVKKTNFENLNNGNQWISFPARHANVLPIQRINTTPATYSPHSTPSSSIQSLYNKQLLHSNGVQSNFVNQNQVNPFYWLGQHPNNQNLNFVPSYPFHENSFSELDPLYHGTTALTTPSDISSSHISGTNEFNADVYNTDPRFASQLPLQNHDDDSIFDASTEARQTTITNTEPSFTTPFNAITTTTAASASLSNSENLQIEDENNLYPDSINAQLPPPESGADIRVPYVDTDKSEPTSPRFKQKINIKNHRENMVSTERIEVQEIFDKSKKKSSQSRYKTQKSSKDSSTEKPSWTPKRPRLRSSDRFKTNSEIQRNSADKHYANRRKITVRKTTTTSEPITSTVTQDFTTENEPITSTVVPQIEDQPRTSQSVQKSVSVHIAEKVTVMPRKSAKVVINSRTGEIKKSTIGRANIEKVEKNIENSTEESLEQ